MLIGAMLRFGALDEPMYARRAADTGEVVLVPQVPQREVRTQVRPEFHQCLAQAGFYSAVERADHRIRRRARRRARVARLSGPAVHVRRPRLRRGGRVAHRRRDGPGRAGSRGVGTARPARGRAGRVDRPRRLRPRGRVAAGRGLRTTRRSRSRASRRRSTRRRRRSPSCSAPRCPSARSARSATSSIRRTRSRTTFERLRERRVRLLHRRDPARRRRRPRGSCSTARSCDRPDATPCCVLYVAHAVT